MAFLLENFLFRKFEGKNIINTMSVIKSIKIDLRFFARLTNFS